MILISAPVWASKQTTCEEYAELRAESSCWSRETFCFGCQACLFCRNIRAAQNDQMACSRICRAWTWHAYKPQKEKSCFRGVGGLVFSFLKIPDNSFPVKSVFFHFDDSRFLLKQATEQGLICKIRRWFLFSKTFPFNNDILKLWACVCFAVAVVASVWKAEASHMKEQKKKERLC